MKCPKDTRDKLWSELENEIQCRVPHKDKKFILKGRWKKFMRKEKKYKIYAVNGRWIRNNVCVYFGHGGHPLVHEFIPKNEIWVSTHHYNENKASIAQCECKTRVKNQKVSKACFESTVIHEIEEYEQMKKGKKYWEAHQRAFAKERKAALMKDIWDDR